MSTIRVFESALLTPNEMRRADVQAIGEGTAGIVLMERAASAVADLVVEAYPQASRIALLAGPGNNGGDAYAAARQLTDRGRSVTVFALGDPAGLSGDASLAAQAYRGNVQPLGAFDPPRLDLIVDGLFGAGLSRPVEGEAAPAIHRANGSGRPIVAIDLPSGISGTSGGILGVAIQADDTVTFFRRKPGHLLEPGRAHCGRTSVVDIGISPAVLAEIAPKTFANEPPLWSHLRKTPGRAGHKYDRGHAVIFSGGVTQTGAARMAAMAALRGGAGLVTVFSPASALLVNAAHLTAIMLRRCEEEDEFARHLEDERLNAFVLGPGFGVGEKARRFATTVLGAGRRLVLDADGITSFAADPAALFVCAEKSDVVLTPHMGEFKRLFPRIAADESLSKLEKARAAAEVSGAIMVLKGADSVIAAPDGRAAINATGTPWLATAGSGDVLAGLIAAQLAQGMPSFEAACLAVWMHGKAAEAFGPGLIADDLPGLLPAVLAELATAAEGGG